MNMIKDRANEIKIKAKSHRRYREVSEKTGVGYEWLVKFANDRIDNPGIENIAKLESFFSQVS